MPANDGSVLVQRYFKTVINQHRPELIQDLMTEDFFYVSPAHTSYSRDDFEDYLTNLFAAWSDFKVEVNDIHERDDVVMARMIAEGTRSRVFMDIPASENKFSFPATSQFRIRDGKIQSIQTHYDFTKLVMTD
jgi:steroid delta-isomerase-like uncharacterized protein